MHFFFVLVFEIGLYNLAIKYFFKKAKVNSFSPSPPFILSFAWITPRPSLASPFREPAAMRVQGRNGTGTHRGPGWVGRPTSHLQRP